MRKSNRCLGAMLPLLVLLGACGGASAPAQAPAAEENTAPADAAAAEEESPPPSDLSLAQAAAQATAEAWDTEKAKAEEASFTLKIKVNGKPSTISISGADASILSGKKAAAAADFTVELTSSQAEAIADASTSLAALIKEGEVSSDNEEGLARFAEFLRY